MAEKRELAPVMAMLCEYYERCLSDGVMAVYLDGLSSYNIADVKRAARDHVDDPDRGRWFPKLADFSAHILPPAGSDAAIENASHEAWQTAAAYAAIGHYDTGDRLTTLCIRRLGLARFENMGDGTCGTENRSFVRRDFLAIYKAFAKAEPSTYREAIASSPAHDRIASIARGMLQ